MLRKWLDLTIDGADEFDADLNLIKGVVAGRFCRKRSSRPPLIRWLVIADVGKEVTRWARFRCRSR